MSVYKKDPKLRVGSSEYKTVGKVVLSHANAPEIAAVEKKYLKLVGAGVVVVVVVGGNKVVVVVVELHGPRDVFIYALSKTNVLGIMLNLE